MKSLNEYVKESILDDEDVLMGSIKDNMIGQTIYDKLADRKNLTKYELEWINEKVSVFKIDEKQLRNLIKNLKYNDISLNWLDISNITDMSYIFYRSTFNGDISKWDVSNVEDMSWMFAVSQFNGDISKWNVSKVKNMSYMFYKSKFNDDISDWDVSNVRDVSWMFMYSKFNKDISKWIIDKKCNTILIFDLCPIKNEYKPKFK